MPYKSEKIPLGKYDRRAKLNDVQREEIKELRKLGLSYRVIAERYEVSKSLIILVCNPDIAERKRLAFIERSREGRYKPDKEEWLLRCENIGNIKKNYIRRVRYERNFWE